MANDLLVGLVEQRLPTGRAQPFVIDASKALQKAVAETSRSTPR